MEPPEAHGMGPGRPRAAPGRGRGSTLATSQAEGPGTLLLVDDERDILDSMAAYLAFRMPGTRILQATGADEAMRLLRSQPVDAVVSDLRMPRRDGLQLLADVGRERPGLPRVLITAYPEEDLGERAAAIGVQAILRKPFDLEAFVEAIQATMEDGPAQDAPAG